MSDCVTVTFGTPPLTYPAHLSESDRRLLSRLAERNLAEHGDDWLGLVLSGSAGRGMATPHSDMDVYVVLTDEGLGQRTTSHSRDLDEVPVALSELEEAPAYGTEGWWYRWSFAWAPILIDRTDGSLPRALRTQATVTADEARTILTKHDRLDGYINFAYRALKSDRDGRTFEAQLDAAESVPWLLDVVFSLAGRVRPYNKYLAWELKHHPLADWNDLPLLTLLPDILRGNSGAVRRTFTHVERICRDFDAAHADSTLTSIIEDWGHDLRILHGQ